MLDVFKDGMRRLRLVDGSVVANGSEIVHRALRKVTFVIVGEVQASCSSEEGNGDVR